MSALVARRVLVLEDELLIALAAEQLLAELGALVVGPVATVADGCRLARAAGLDAALLDLHVQGQRSCAVAAALVARAIPFVFTTGDVRAAEELDAPVVRKPYTREGLADALTRVLPR